MAEHGVDGGPGGGGPGGSTANRGPGGSTATHGPVTSARPALTVALWNPPTGVAVLILPAVPSLVERSSRPPATPAPSRHAGA